MPTNYKKPEGKLRYYSLYTPVEIQPGHVIQVNLQLGESKGSHSIIMRVTKKNENSGWLLGEGICDHTGHEYLIHVNQVFRCYSLDPIKPGEKPGYFITNKRKELGRR